MISTRSAGDYHQDALPLRYRLTPILSQAQEGRLLSQYCCGRDPKKYAETFWRQYETEHHHLKKVGSSRKSGKQRVRLASNYALILVKPANTLRTGGVEKPIPDYGTTPYSPLPQTSTRARRIAVKAATTCRLTFSDNDTRRQGKPAY